MLPQSLLSLIALAAVVAAEPLHVPLTRRSSPLRRDNVIDPERLAKARDFLQIRYGYKAAPSRRRRRAGQTVGIATINSVSCQPPELIRDSSGVPLGRIGSSVCKGREIRSWDARVLRCTASRSTATSRPLYCLILPTCLLFCMGRRQRNRGR